MARSANLPPNTVEWYLAKCQEGHCPFAEEQGPNSCTVFDPNLRPKVIKACIARRFQNEQECIGERQTSAVLEGSCREE